MGKSTISIFLAIIILFTFSTVLKGQCSDRYNVLLHRDNSKELEIYDTIVALDFLSELKHESLTNMQNFEGFGYQKFNINIEEGHAILTNDSIKILLSISPFDSLGFKENFKKDSSLYFESLYFREFPADFDYPPFFPKTEISKIEISINNRKINIPKQYSKNLHNPSLNCWTYKNKKNYGINGYVANNDKILLTLICGEGAGSYIVIFVIDKSGKIEKRIVEPVI